MIDGRKSEDIVLHDGKVPRKVLCLRRTEMGGGGEGIVLCVGLRLRTLRYFCRCSDAAITVL